ncbi:hypothetical protein NG895_25195 [Aeoliella sp. ICT_H6.2]|uniref:Tetratricopeptide repeat protein n=1 Tax=Aeoliella straminimaris TaxID=2954799 RepID=A0A9X2FHV7_9BACT|nr:hypothetical protein [Aeoliella straminimaris]MCO6047209.1 hypothetical protein [Aeoliella straminimaris]
MRFLTLACCLSLSSWVVAQDTSGLSEYQQGAGAYFAGRIDQAEEHLTAALESDPNDIRAYYLRGLNRLHAGNLPGAQADLAKGAELEVQRGPSPLIDQSLSSVQGSARVTLERIRRAARRSAVVQQQRAALESRKQQREQQEKRVLRTDYQLPIEALASRLTVEQARQVAVKAKQGPGSAVATAEPAAPPTAEIETDSDNPFADDSYNEDQTFAATANEAAGTDEAPASDGVDIPAAARGSISSAQLFEIVGEVIGQAVQDRAGSVTGAVPPMGPMGPGGPPPGMMGGGEGGFGGPADGQGFPADEQGSPAAQQLFPEGEMGSMNDFSAPAAQQGGSPFNMQQGGQDAPQNEPAGGSPFDLAE